MNKLQVGEERRRDGGGGRWPPAVVHTTQGSRLRPYACVRGACVHVVLVVSSVRGVGEYREGLQGGGGGGMLQKDTSAKSPGALEGLKQRPKGHGQRPGGFPKAWVQEGGGGERRGEGGRERVGGVGWIGHTTKGGSLSRLVHTRRSRLLSIFVLLSAENTVRVVLGTGGGERDRKCVYGHVFLFPCTGERVVVCMLIGRRVRCGV